MRKNWHSSVVGSLLSKRQEISRVVGDGTFFENFKDKDSVYVKSLLPVAVAGAVAVAAVVGAGGGGGEVRGGLLLGLLGRGHRRQGEQDNEDLSS